MSDIKNYFISRWGGDGCIMEVDFSQLEVIGLAWLSGDKQLMDDILSGIDLHSVNAEKLFGKGFTPKQRKIAKSFSFQLQYGAGAKSMAESNRVAIDIAKQFIKNYYERYPRVEQWQEEIREEVVKTRVPSTKRTKAGLPAGMGYCKSPTGRRYVFHEYDAPQWSKDGTSFSPTQMKNYPVQGFATGDIVPMVLGKLWRTIKTNPDLNTACKMINTIHDSILFDVKREHVVNVAVIVKAVMEDAPNYLKEDFGIDFDLPLSVGIEVGDTWGSVKEFDI